MFFDDDTHVGILGGRDSVTLKLCDLASQSRSLSLDPIKIN